MEASAAEYKTKATALRDHYWWKDTRMQALILAAVVCVVLLAMYKANFFSPSERSSPATPVS